MWKFINSNKTAIVFLAIFAVSLIYSFSFKYTPVVDAGAYDEIAWNLAQGFGYRESLEGSLEKDHGIIRAGPGYEFFLAGIYKVFGHRYGMVWFFQSLFHALSAFLVFLIVKNILNHEKKEVMAVLAMAFYGFFPDMIVSVSMLLTETLAIFLLLLSFYIFLKHIDKECQSQALPSLAKPGFDNVLLGLAAAFMVLVKSQLVLFILPLLVFLILKRRWSHLILIFILFILVLTPWTIRNYLVFEKIIPTAVLFGNNLAMGNHPGATGEQLDAYYPAIDDFFREGYIKGDKLALNFALNFIAGNPLEFAKLTLYRISMYSSFARPTGFWPSFSSLNKIVTLILSGLYSFSMFILGLAGVLFSLKRGRDLFFKKKLLYTLIIAFLMPLSVVFIIAETRYRYPIYPFLAIFSGVAFWHIYHKRKEMIKYFLRALFLISANGAFDIIRNFSRIVARINNL